MVAGDVAFLYPGIPNDAGEQALRKTLDDWVNKKISTDNLTKIADILNLTEWL